MPAGRDRLRDPRPRRALLTELRRTQRLVLLGDVVELRQGPLAQALQSARGVLAELAGALPADAEVVLVPGNHDHHLLERWRERRAADPVPQPLHAETTVEIQAGDPLAALTAGLTQTRLRVSYPGVWLRPDVYATHGHYADRHTTVPMLERLAAGVTARVTAEPADGPRAIEHYEAVLAPVYAWIHAVAQSGAPRRGANTHGGASAGAWQTLTGAGTGSGAATSGWRLALTRDSLRRRGLVAGFAGLVALLNRAGLGPLRAELSGSELRRASLRALAEVLERLSIEAEFVISGHTHRAGPLPGDDGTEWRAAGRRLTNCGCWIHEPAFLGPEPRTSPYRAGFAVRLQEQGAPELVNLLAP